MNEIICPNCGTAFKIDESGMAEIVKQVRDREFEKEIENRQKTWSEDKEKSITLAVKDVKEELLEKIYEKDRINTELVHRLEAAGTREKLAVTEATKTLEQELQTLRLQLKHKDEAIESEIRRKAEAIEQLKKDMENQNLENQIKTREIISSIEKERDKLLNDINLKDKEKELAESALKQEYELALKQKEDEIAYYKELKAKQSTKMVGETLEQHCQIEFNRMRATAFKNAYFEKDNDVVDGSKADFIYREND